MSYCYNEYEFVGQDSAGFSCPVRNSGHQVLGPFRNFSTGDSMGNLPIAISVEKFLNRPFPGRAVHQSLLHTTMSALISNRCTRDSPRSRGRFRWFCMGFSQFSWFQSWIQSWNLQCLSSLNVTYRSFGPKGTSHTGHTWWKSGCTTISILCKSSQHNWSKTSGTPTFDVLWGPKLRYVSY